MADTRLEQIAYLAETHGYEPDAMVAAAEILAALKATAPEHRMNALAIACRVFCDTDGTLEINRPASPGVAQPHKEHR